MRLNGTRTFAPDGALENFENQGSDEHRESGGEDGLIARNIIGRQNGEAATPPQPAVAGA